MKQPLHQAPPRQIPDAHNPRRPLQRGPAETRTSLEARRGPDAAAREPPTRRFRAREGKAAPTTGAGAARDSIRVWIRP